jgi:hypothetical protein
MNPLFRHINRHRSYYFGVLIQAAVANPSLRDDAPQLANINYNSPLWQLSIIGVEGNHLLVLKNPDRNPDGTFVDAALQRLIEQDKGAATIIQLAAPGAYGEALQGLLALTGTLPVADVTSLLGKLVDTASATGTPALASLQGVPVLSAIPGVTSLPAVGGATGVPVVPLLPVIPGVPALPGAPVVPGVPAGPGAPGLP